MFFMALIIFMALMVLDVRLVFLPLMLMRAVGVFMGIFGLAYFTGFDDFAGFDGFFCS